MVQRYGLHPIQKIGWSVLIFIVMFIPLWLFIVSTFLMSPHGFWQKLFLGVVGMFFLGFIQLIFLVVGVALIFIVVTDGR